MTLTIKLYHTVKLVLTADTFLWENYFYYIPVRFRLTTYTYYETRWHVCSSYNIIVLMNNDMFK